MLLKLLSKLSVPTLHFQSRPILTPPNKFTTLYPTLSPEAASRTANRFSVMSFASTVEAEINSWSSSPNEPSTPVNEIEEIIPLISINVEQEIHRVAYKTLQQCIDLLRNLHSDDSYVFESKFIPNSTIGKHVRHLYEHFQLLLESKPLKARRFVSEQLDHDDYHYDEPKGVNTKLWAVDYDDRSRDIPVETLRLTAIKQLERLQDTILNDSILIPLNTPIQINATVDSEMLMDPIPLQSTYGRELWFCCHHAIHHFALIRVICTEQNIVVPEDFGVAPSTLKKRYELELVEKE
ncbi:8437_t:CDS:2 [Funneliformis geosporum]|uniref:7677_t:CDS:1 n=1 Tax=Funneliformis geosporum TaxID=1117311 RepID=A0A9W4WZ91_9GLOM|nr:8437_t:CDS:2 [Funneliformis geosporum]CAI2183464.1 7677_t:CDS:2 [Funneliformis geosporum]